MRKMGNGPLVAHVFHPNFWVHAQALRPDWVIYHPFDLFDKQPGWNSELADAQNALLKHADLVVAPSRMLADALTTKCSRHVDVVLNAADFASFSGSQPGTSVPDDLAPIPHPRIGYAGNINRKVDFSLIHTLAVRRPKWQFVFIGRVGNLDAVSEQFYEKCKALPNVHFLGEKLHSILPTYISNMDVNMMCYRMDDAVWTQVAYPLKLHEYLATGKPIVSSNLESLRNFTDVLAIGTGANEWETCLREAIEGRAPGSLEERRAIAQANTWDDRVGQINQLIMRMVEGTRSTQHVRR